MYRVHFTDDYGQGAIDVETYADAVELSDSIRNDSEHVGWDIWIENLSGEEW